MEQFRPYIAASLSLRREICQSPQQTPEVTILDFSRYNKRIRSRGVPGSMGSPPGLPQTPSKGVHLRPPARGEVREEERQVEVDHPAVGHDLARHLSHRPQGGGLPGGHHVEGGS